MELQLLSKKLPSFEAFACFKRPGTDSWVLKDPIKPTNILCLWFKSVEMLPSWSTMSIKSNLTCSLSSCLKEKVARSLIAFVKDASLTLIVVFAVKSFKKVSKREIWCS